MKNYKRMFLSLLLVFILLGLVGCNNVDKDPVLENPVVDNAEAEDIEDTEEKDDPVDKEDDLDVMISESTYISKVKLITKGKKGSEIKVLENIKEVVNRDQLPELNLEENRAYIVFLKDDGDNVVLVDSENSVVLLEGDNHELFEKINKQVHN